MHLGRTAFVCVALGLSVLVACAGGDSAPEPDSATAAASPPTATNTAIPTATEAPPTAQSEFAQLANQLVIAGDGRYFANIIDFEGALEAFDFQPPSTCDSDENLQQYGDDLAGLSRLPLTQGGLLLAYIFGLDPQATFEEFGIRLCEITMTADDVSPDRGSQLIMRVESDPADIDRAVHNDPTWSDLLTPSEVNDGTLYEWGIEVDIERSTPFRPLRTGGALFVRDDIVVRTDRTESIDAYVDGSGRRLGDEPHVNQVFASLERRGAVQIVLTNVAYTIDSNLAVDTAVIDSFGEALEPWDVLGIGLTADARNEPLALVTIAHRSEQAAQENLSRLSRTLREESSFDRLAPWSEFLEVVDLEVDGVMVHATLAGEAPTLILAVALLSGDNLFAVEDQD